MYTSRQRKLTTFRQATVKSTKNETKVDLKNRRTIYRYVKKQGTIIYENPEAACESIGKILGVPARVVENALQFYLNNRSIRILSHEPGPFVLKFTGEKGKPRETESWDPFRVPRLRSYPINPHVSSKH